MNPRFSPFSSASSVPLSASFNAKALWLLTLALALTIVGVALGVTLALPILASGWIILLFIGELAIVWTAPVWSRSSPLNVILFAAFPILSGITLTPIIISVLAGYANGASILMNALIATVLLTASSAVMAKTYSNLGGIVGPFLLQSLIGLIVFGILQLFIPALRGTAFEMIASGVGIVTFALFLAVDIQRLLRRGDATSPFLLAIGLYLDIYNLFLYVLRFMLATSGRRR